MGPFVRAICPEGKRYLFLAPSRHMNIKQQTLVGFITGLSFCQIDISIIVNGSENKRLYIVQK